MFKDIYEFNKSFIKYYNEESDKGFLLKLMLNIFKS